MSERSPALYFVLLTMGAGWGLTVPLSKIAVSTGHQPLGLIFWQLVVVVVLLGAICVVRRKPLELGMRYWRLYVAIAMCGAVLPDIVFYMSASRLPGGILAIVMATAPLFSLPIALALGNERFAWRRLLGLSFGLVGIALLVGPEASLPERAMAAFIPVALLAPLLYATEGNLVAKWGTQGLDPIQTILGASLLGLAISTPLALATGQWVNPLASFGAPEVALVLSAAVHGLVYAVYVWLVNRAGAVFVSQSSYLVTGFGVVWSMVLLHESYAIWVWLALAIMMGGMVLVQPRRRVSPLAPITSIGQNTPSA